MPTFTPNYDLAKPLVADAVDEDLWGDYLNDNMDIIDTIMATFASNANPTFTGTITIDGVLNEDIGADIASAATVNLTTATGNTVTITGTASISAITLAVGAKRTVRAGGAFTLVHSDPALRLPSAANIVAAVGDYFEIVGTSGGADVVDYQRYSGQSLVQSNPIFAWGVASVSGGVATLNASLNVASVTRTSSGIFQVVFTSAAANTNYAITLGQSTVADTRSIMYNTKLTTGFNINTTNGSTPNDANEISFVVMGS